MKKLHSLVLGSLLVGVLVTGMPSAFAQTATTTVGTTTPPVPPEMPQMAVHIERNGDIKLVGKLTAISGHSLTVASWGGNWAVDAGSAKIVRRFNGESNLAEYQVGDTIVVWGQASMNGLSVTAKMVKDESLQKRSADFFGIISGLNASSTNSFTLNVEEKGALTILVNTDTKISLNGQPASSTASLANGMYARVRGVWDRNSSTVVAASIEAKTVAAILDQEKPNFLKKLFHFFSGKHKGKEDQEKHE